MAQKKGTTTAVAETSKQTTALATQLVDMSADSGAGFEAATKDSYAIPFMALLQSGSPQCKKSDGAYIKGATEGMLLNSVTNEVFDGDAGITVMPCAYTLTYVQWAPRESGGGFKGEHDVATGMAMMRETIRDEKGRDVLSNGDHLAQTHNFYCVILTDTGPQRAVLSLTSTQIKKAKRWMTAMSQLRAKRADGTSFQPPMFANLWTASTTAESNDKGSWFGWQFDHARPLDLADAEDVQLYLEARSFKDAILKGELKVASREGDAAATISDDDAAF